MLIWLVIGVHVGCAVYFPVALWIFANLRVLKESCILCKDVKKRRKRQINQGRMKANIDIKANLFHFNVDYARADRANIANEGCKQYQGLWG